MLPKRPALTSAIRFRRSSSARGSRQRITASALQWGAQSSELSSRFSVSPVSRFIAAAPRAPTLQLPVVSSPFAPPARQARFLKPHRSVEGFPNSDSGIMFQPSIRGVLQRMASDKVHAFNDLNFEQEVIKS